MPAWAQSAERPSNELEFCAFEKFIQDLSYDELADVLAEMGFQGVEATVRRGGRIEAKAVEDELPKLHEVLAKRGLGITVMTTDILRADDPQSQKVIETAAKLGIKRYRTGNFRYHATRPILTQLDEWKPQVVELAAFNREQGIQGLYQNHSGANFVGGTVWDVHYLIRDLDPQDFGIAFDIRHATVEANLSWDVLYRVAKPHIGALYVKDFDRQGKKITHAPLGHGIDPAFFKTFLRDDLDVPVSLHVEYLPDAGTKENVEAIRNDFKTLKKWLGIS
jgi:sugar phosphate isomerase/epimerase